ncbi:BCCT family transporter [Desulfolutivibrio sulfoxidireducens]|uniref:BCCT family transporter n=1 Tax=Desulfolutivibrio sulfoxidireducens TaxID=2773299 RepID=UPI00159D30C6|nr:BCCT family transporter [Desulfolutivibrio sulfoxidireducens]QLA15701.1 BCCT family transporter [Desulfolutivibrio sulfoxidireducens]QLA19306.1 BCCT family transporter [Desulfolutivibrio sulfoxidireducens]
MSQYEHPQVVAACAASPAAKSPIRKMCFLGTMFLVLASGFPLLAYPEAGERVINSLFTFVTVKLGWLYLLSGMGSLSLILWFAFGPLGHKRLGEKVEYSTFSWLGMLFCAGVGAGIMFGGSIDWAYYMKYSLQGAAVGSLENARMGCAYGMFHWGPVCWAIYATLAVPIGYSYYVKKVPVLNLSQVCAELLGDRAHAWPGKVVDILFMAGLVGGSATALGLGVPIVAAAVASVAGIELSFPLECATLAGVTLIFSVTSSLGLKRGMCRLSDINVYLALGLLAFVFLVGPTLFLTDMGISSLGLLASQFVRMATWIDPAGENGFTQSWTVFYYAWFVAYAPFMSLFIAKISRGRTVRQVALGPVILASLGCGCFYMIFGNFGLHLQLTGQLDVVNMVKTGSGATAIMAIADFIPFSALYRLLFAAVTAICMATTFDAVSFALAATTTRTLSPDEEPARWNRLFWAISLGLLPSGILFINGPLSVLQTASIVVGLPVLCVVWLGVASFLTEYRRTGWVIDQTKPEA